MSASITIHCNTEWRYGNCPGQLLTDADTVDEARAAARAQGWVTHSNGRDMCASCSGRGPQPASAVVAVLHPERPR
jgi:hypothetical protein